MATTEEKQNSQPKLKTYPKIPVHIVEDHNEVLIPIYRAIGSKHLPLGGLALLHFDSHPDLLIPQNLKADDVYDKHKLFSELSIENWIVPSVYAGHVDTVVWVKPPWAQQMRDQCAAFTVGKDRQTGHIRVSSQEDYFVSELLYTPEEQLDQGKELYLGVLTLDFPSDLELAERALRKSQEQETPKPETSREADSNTEEAPKRRSQETGEESATSPKQARLDDNFSVNNNNPATTLHNDNQTAVSGHSGQQNQMSEVLHTLLEKYILDIDLDFYSTRNPFKLMYTAEQYQMLKELYYFGPLTEKSNEAIEKRVKERKAQISALKDIFHKVQETGEPPSGESEREKLVTQFVTDLKKTREGQKIDWEWVHEAGCTCDNTELPHHRSSPEQISELITQSASLLRGLPTPTLITIARSSDDDYCPKDQVDAIQEQVLRMLRDLYGEVEVNALYKQESPEQTTSE